MSEIDIGTNLYEKVKTEFEKSIADNKTIQDFLKRIENKTATMRDMSQYTMTLGDTLAEALKKHITQDALPDGKMYYNIADKVLTPMMEQNHTLVNYRACEVQRAINKAKGIGIEPQKAKFPAKRVKSIVNGVAHAEDWETTAKRLDSPIRNAVNSYLDDFVETNADFAYKSGLNTYIIRQESGKCCKWCASLAGKYRYPDEVPKDVYRRHDNCTCTTTFVSEKGLQNVWSKKKWKPTAEQVEQMKAIEPKAAKISVEKAKTIESKNIHVKKMSKIEAKQIEEKTTEKFFTKSQLEKMNIEKLRKETSALAKRYYASGKSGISFGGANPDEVAEKLSANASRSSLIKDYMSMKKKLATKNVDFLNESGIIKEEITKGNIKLEINHEKQARHFKNSDSYVEGRSYLTISEDKAQQIINDKSGTGTLIFDKNGKPIKEKIITDDIIGVDIDFETKEETLTEKGTIHYSKTGTHLVPRKELKHHE